ncbi:GNAT family N-acetyltransferase [Methanotorris igneus]|uniref:GCN5-related N-acetyltransferase n=1 Tax=Methanotorris igneus (strain DSM 5666 / JCM 11834 / Kol 5) TaxID=880724 RepID=F6BCJ9_METIK|nr:GNAT family N-acetyltransferase [Methanotorris igneus]AEF96210.1 GCN5-related N-acetyltransferase [Methanotorris igneus Kol 5]
MITIDTAKKEDIDDMINLLKQLFEIEKDFTPNYEKQRKGLELLLNSKNAVIFVARYNGKVVGMCSIQTLISTAEGGKVGILEDLVVDENFRGKGIGSKLLSEAERYCKEKGGLLRLSLLADKDNKKALEFYKSRGWKFTNLICLRKFFGE